MPDIVAKRLDAVPPALQRLFAPLALAASRGLGVLAQVLLQIVVGSLGGAAGLGLLQLFTSWTSVIGEVVGGGYPTRVLKDSAVQSAAGDYDAVRATLRHAAARVASVAACGATVGVLLFLSGALAPSGAAATVLAVLVSAPLFAGARLCAEALKGLDRPLAAVTLENLSMPVTLLLVCGTVAAAGLQLSSALLLGGAALGTAATLLSLAFFVWRAVGRRASSGIAPRSSIARSEQVHFWANGLLNIAFLQLPFLLLPLFATADEIGRFAVAHKLVNIITTLLILLAAVFGPRFARAAAREDATALRALLARTQAISSLIFIPGAAALLLFAAPLAALFSLPAGSLDLLLAVLCAGQLVNALTGLPGVLLTLSGGARLEMRLQAASTLLTALVLVLLGSEWGASGVAVAVTAGIAVKNLASYLAALNHLRNMGKNLS